MESYLLELWEDILPPRQIKHFKYTESSPNYSEELIQLLSDPLSLEPIEPTLCDWRLTNSPLLACESGDLTDLSLQIFDDNFAIFSHRRNKT